MALLFPNSFLWIREHTSILLGIVMCGMGMTLFIGVFFELVRKPKSASIGVLLQFTPIPSIAYFSSERFLITAGHTFSIILAFMLGLIVKLTLKQQIEKKIPILSLVPIIAIVVAVIAGSKEQILQSELFILRYLFYEIGLDICPDLY